MPRSMLALAATLLLTGPCWAENDEVCRASAEVRDGGTAPSSVEATAAATDPVATRQRKTASGTAAEPLADRARWHRFLPGMFK